ncbi:MAG: hypothetical protein U1E92_03750 [Moraxella osloensis]
MTQKVVAQTTIAALLDIMEDDDDLEDQAEQIAEEIEEEFFNHCLICHDRLAFSMVW